MRNKTNEYEEYLRWFKNLNKEVKSSPATTKRRISDWDKFFNDYEGGKDNERV
jgi:hypothetical protein